MKLILFITAAAAVQMENDNDTQQEKAVNTMQYDDKPSQDTQQHHEYTFNAAAQNDSDSEKKASKDNVNSQEDSDPLQKAKSQHQASAAGPNPFTSNQQQYQSGYSVPNKNVSQAFSSANTYVAPQQRLSHGPQFHPIAHNQPQLFAPRITCPPLKFVSVILAPVMPAQNVIPAQKVIPMQPQMPKLQSGGSMGSQVNDAKQVSRIANNLKEIGIPSETLKDYMHAITAEELDRIDPEYLKRKRQFYGRNSDKDLFVPKGHLGLQEDLIIPRHLENMVLEELQELEQCPATDYLKQWLLQHGVEDIKDNSSFQELFERLMPILAKAFIKDYPEDAWRHLQSLFSQTDSVANIQESDLIETYLHYLQTGKRMHHASFSILDYAELSVNFVDGFTDLGKETVKKNLISARDVIFQIIFEISEFIVLTRMRHVQEDWSHIFPNPDSSIKENLQALQNCPIERTNEFLKALIVALSKNKIISADIAKALFAEFGKNKIPKEDKKVQKITKKVIRKKDKGNVTQEFFRKFRSLESLQNKQIQ